MKQKLTKLAAFFILVIAITLQHAEASKLYLYPDSIDVIAGDSFVLEVRLDTEGESVNAVDITGNVDDGIVENVLTADSIIEILIHAGALDSDTFHFIGGIPGGYVGNGVIGRVSITAVKPGTLAVTFGEESIILGESGKSLKDQTATRGSNINVLQPSENHILITSKSHPDQNKWYNEKDLHLHWDLEEGTEYSYLVSLDPMAVPDDTPDRPKGELLWLGDINIGGLNEGIYYFTLKRVGQDALARFRTMIDTTPPEWVGFEVSEGVPETNYQAFVTFLAKDKQSGINHYEVKVDNERPQNVLAPYILPSGYLNITISAIDNAGNHIEKNIIGDSQRNILVLYAIVGLMVLGAAVVAIRPIRERIFTKQN